MDELKQPVVGHGQVKKMVAVAVATLIAVIVTIVVYFEFFYSQEDLSGVWKSQDSGQTYVLDKIADDKLDYRLTVAGHRLLVESVDADATHHQISLTVRTDSGLKAIWTFAVAKNANDKKISSLTLDQDGLAVESLIFQRLLTNTDKVRISHLKPNRNVLWSPAFSCEKAASDVERLICTYKELAVMDSQVSRLVKSADSNTKNVQKVWLKEVRDVCNDQSCLRSAYQARIETLTVVPDVADPVVEDEPTEEE